jgi:hypothetical protein
MPRSILREGTPIPPAPRLWGGAPPFASAVALVSALVGCIDPNGTYDDFVARREAAQDHSDGDVGDGDPDVGKVPGPDQITGQYLYVVTLDTFEPTFYLLDLEAQQEGAQLSVSMRSRPLAYADRMTPIGEFNEWETYQVDEAGWYETSEMMFDVPGRANSLDVDATVSHLTVRGNVASGELESDEPDSRVAYFCGEIGAEVEVFALGVTQKPGGGHFAASRIADDGTFPPAISNCEGDLAEEP